MRRLRCGVSLKDWAGRGGGRIAAFASATVVNIDVALGLAAVLFSGFAVS
jgi:hypothetical protein